MVLFVSGFVNARCMYIYIYIYIYIQASLNLFIARACATQFVKNIGVFDSPRVRFRILSSSSGTSPASPASSASAPAKNADDASDAGDVRKVGKALREEKGEDLRGEKALGGKGGERISTGNGGKTS